MVRNKQKALHSFNLNVKQEKECIEDQKQEYKQCINLQLEKNIIVQQEECRKRMVKIILDINRFSNVADKVKKLGREIDKLEGYKINLKLDVYISKDQEAINFFRSFEKNVNKDKIFYLNWKFSGCYSDKSAQEIGNFIGKFLHLYSLKLNIHSSSVNRSQSYESDDDDDDYDNILKNKEFEELKILSLIDGFKKLNNVHILKLKLQYFFSEFIKDEIKKQFLQTINDMPHLEVLFYDFNKQETLLQNLEILSKESYQLSSSKESNYCKGPKNLVSSFYYQNLSTFSKYKITLENEKEDIKLREMMLEEFKRNLNHNKNMITSIHFETFQCTYQYVPPFFEKQIVLCFNLPYLTSFEIESSLETVEITQLLYHLVHEKIAKIHEIIVYYFTICQHLPFNYLWALTDFYFD